MLFELTDLAETFYLANHDVLFLLGAEKGEYNAAINACVFFGAVTNDGVDADALV